VTALLVGVALAGCGDDSEPTSQKAAAENTAAAATPSEAPEGRLLTSQEAKAVLPAVTDLPGSGWKPSPTGADESDPKVSPESCSPVMNEISTDFLGYKSKLAAKENVTFANDTTGQTELLFEVASWTEEADSGLPLAAAKLADQCKSFTATGEGVELKFTAETLSPLPIGDEQAAVRLTADYQGTKVYLTVFEAKIGHNLVSMVQTSPEPTDRSAEYKPILDAMLAKLKAA